MTNQSLERALIERAWREPEFCRLMETDPGAAAKALGMQLPDGVKLKIQIQRRDTLYFVIPPMAKRPEDASTDINQMDLWQSADLFCWIIPQGLKLELLAMRQAYRKAHP